VRIVAFVIPSAASKGDSPEFKKAIHRKQPRCHVNGGFHGYQWVSSLSSFFEEGEVFSV
jgi:hypothetical protein